MIPERFRVSMRPTSARSPILREYVTSRNPSPRGSYMLAKYFVSTKGVEMGAAK